MTFLRGLVFLALFVPASLAMAEQFDKTELYDLRFEERGIYVVNESNRIKKIGAGQVESLVQLQNFLLLCTRDSGNYLYNLKAETSYPTRMTIVDAVRIVNGLPVVFGHNSSDEYFSQDSRGQETVSQSVSDKAMKDPIFPIFEDLDYSRHNNPVRIRGKWCIPGLKFIYSEKYALKIYDFSVQVIVNLY